MLCTLASVKLRLSPWYFFKQEKCLELVTMELVLIKNHCSECLSADYCQTWKERSLPCSVLVSDLI